MKQLKLKTNLPILILVAVVTCYLVLKDSLGDIKEMISNANLLILFIGLIILLISDLFKAMSVHSIAKKSNLDLSIKEAFYLTLETNFFNGVTPFALGGQPFQLYLLKKRNKIGYLRGTNILFCDYYVYQITLILLVMILYLLNLIFDFITLNSVMKAFLLTGFLIHFAIFIFLIYITYSKSKDSKVAVFLIHVLSKLKVVKDEDAKIEEVLEKINTFRKLIHNFVKDYRLVFKTVIFNLLKLTLYSTLPFLCFKAIGVSDIGIMTSIICGIFIWTIASFIPIPGATGGMEYSFITMFTSILSESTVKSGMLLWRFISYYIFIIIGALIFVLTNMEKSNKK